MGKFEAKKTKKKFSLWIPVVVVLLLAAALLLSRFLPAGEEQVPSEPAEETNQAAQPEQAQTEPDSAGPVSTEQIVFPAQVQDGMLELQMLFQFSGLNPDCGYQEAENIAALELHNVSGSYLTEASLALTLDDGTVLHFTVTELPAGSSVIAFDLDNTEIAADARCVDITCEAAFAEPDASVSSKLAWSVEDGIVITVSNISGEDLSDIVVYCRSPFGEDYFGGITYQYTIEELPVGESATVEALDCILGDAEVVRVAISES